MENGKKTRLSHAEALKIGIALSELISQVEDECLRICISNGCYLQSIGYPYCPLPSVDSTESIKR